MLAFINAACGAGSRRCRSITWLCSAPPQPPTMRTSSAIPGSPLPPSRQPNVSRMSLHVALRVAAGRSARLHPHTCSANAHAGSFIGVLSASWRRSVNGVAADLRAAHDAAERASIVHRQMLGAAIVPECDGAIRPAEAAGELRPMAVFQQIFQQWPALGLCPTFEADGVGAVDEQQLAAGFRMRAYHRVYADGFAPAGILAHLGRAVCVHVGLGAGNHAVCVHGPEAFQRALQAGRECFVGEILVGEQRIAAIGRHLDGVEDGAHRWFLHHRGVGLPVLADDLLVAGLAADVDNLGVRADAVIVGVDEDFAEAAGEGFVLIPLEVLVAEEDHAVVEERLADFAYHAVVEVPRDIDAADLGAECAGDRRKFDVSITHWWLLLGQTLSNAVEWVKLDNAGEAR